MFDVFEGVKGNEESNIRGGGRRVRGNTERVRAEEGRGELENGRPAERPACLPACWPVKGCIIYRRVFLFRRRNLWLSLGMKVYTSRNCFILIQRDIHIHTHIYIDI